MGAISLLLQEGIPSGDRDPLGDPSLRLRLLLRFAFLLRRALLVRTKTRSRWQSK